MHRMKHTFSNVHVQHDPNSLLCLDNYFLDALHLMVNTRLTQDTEAATFILQSTLIRYKSTELF